ncbi:MAG: AraC family transcriptional regulator [Alicyclobacillus sp.]|nr:AraC family transcriptional regulator [Alicyclobacillus sp.]
MDTPYHELTDIPDKTFPMNTFHCERFLPHWHHHLEWVCVLRGCARLQVDGDFAEMHPGELTFINSEQIHSAIPLATDTELVAIVFNDAILRNSGLDCTDSRYFSPLVSNRISLPNFIKMDDPLWPDIAPSIQAIVEEFAKRKPGYELFIKSELLKIFGLIFRYYSPMSESKRLRQETGNFTALLGYLREHFSETVSVRDAARMVNMSPNYFCKVFKRLTGKTLVEYLHILRVMEAERLLLETDLPITTIASDVGFGNVTYFGRVFKKYKNITPSDVRRMASS